ncbi:MAG: excinuclease ABC subunit UvrC [Devosiaceae bacterium]|nr:excinuclease ABC subunit UvrC [Devosiaceae bacterium]
MNQSSEIIGTKIIATYVKNLPNSAGVYRMLDENSNVLYVGKALSLKKRVKNYTSFKGNSNRICRMISATRSMEFVQTNSESEALLLEANMIKRYKPQFNVLMRDDKGFPYILITNDHQAPELKKHRGVRNIKGQYFGPFASGNAVNTTIDILQRAFLLRNCSNSYFANRTRPCLQYQIKRCSAPCTGEISQENYAKLADDACDFLRGKSNKIQQELAKQMTEAAQNQDYEAAAILRDRIAALAHIRSKNDMSATHVNEADIFAIYKQAGQFCVQVFFYRAFQNWGNHAFYPRADGSLNESEVLSAFISQFYENRMPPKLVLVSHDLLEKNLLEQALSISLDSKVAIIKPKKGEKHSLISNALNNAKQALGRKLSHNLAQKKLLEGMAEAFALDKTPRRIEVYDNSHISGTNAIGAMIVAGIEGFAKKQYRTFNIKSETITPGDDFGMMSEVLSRRFARLAKQQKLEIEKQQSENGIPDYPDVMLIDGGKGQLSAVAKSLKEYNLPFEITLIAIAKGEDRNAGKETFYMLNKKPMKLEAGSPVLYFVQRLRDEAHRFAIGTHRAKRNKQMIKNPLDEISGIGASRKKALLNHFGSAKATSRASFSDLKNIEGISAALAKKIHDHFRNT